MVIPLFVSRFRAAMTVRLVIVIERDMETLVLELKSIFDANMPFALSGISTRNDPEFSAILWRVDVKNQRLRGGRRLTDSVGEVSQRE